MNGELTRAEVRRQIERFIRGEITPGALAKWAFDQFYAYEEDRLTYEAGYEDAIDDVLDELMFIDTPEFELDEATARELQAALDLAQEEEEE